VLNSVLCVGKLWRMAVREAISVSVSDARRRRPGIDHLLLLERLQLIDSLLQMTVG